MAFSDPTSLLRIIEQPDTPVDLLRNALRLNGMTVLNQECRDFVLDVAPVNANRSEQPAPESLEDGNVAVQGAVLTQTRYLVGGMLRTSVKQLFEALGKTKLTPDIFQLAPVCSFNAFEVAYPDIFNNDAFLLLDMGHAQSTVLIGNKGELVLIRSIDYGGEALNQPSPQTARSIRRLPGPWCRNQIPGWPTSAAHRSIVWLRKSEIPSAFSRDNARRVSAGFLSRVDWPAWKPFSRRLSDELALPCEIWDPLETCEVALPAAKRQSLPHEFVTLNVACGAAFEYLIP